MFTKLDGYTKLIANLSDKPTETASELKAYFDSSPEEIRVAFNTLIDELASVTDGSSGADGIGATGIEGLDGETVQALLEALKTNDDNNYTSLHDQIQGIVLGQIPDNSITKQKLAFNGADQDILSSTAKDEGASLIGIEDASGHFTSTDVEGVLAELFTNADNAQNSFATVVGSPAQVGDTVEEITTVVQDAKNTMATNLTNKGQTSTGTEELQALADKIANVNTGKKSSSGTATASAATLSFEYAGSTATANRYYLEVTGLNFIPSFIVMRNVASGSTGKQTVFVNQGSYFSSYPDGKIVEGDTFYTNTTAATMNAFKLKGNAYVNSNGFRLPAYGNGMQYEWYAYE